MNYIIKDLFLAKWNKRGGGGIRKHRKLGVIP